MKKEENPVWHPKNESDMARELGRLELEGKKSPGRWMVDAWMDHPLYTNFARIAADTPLKILSQGIQVKRLEVKWH
jgi:hypothetical protein